MAKFLSQDEDGNFKEHDYKNNYYFQPCGNSNRLVIGASNEHIRLLDQLAARVSKQRYYALYVLLLSHSGREPGRYQSPLIQNHKELQDFIWTFKKFFEGDGRHHIWIGSPDSNDLLVYDQHNVIFAYGNLDAFEEILTSNGFSLQEFWFPCPHSHSFDPQNVSAEEELMAYWDWKFSPLQKGDEWD